MNSIVNLKDGFITFNSNIDHSLSFSKCAIGYSNYSINSHERGALVFLTNNNANTANVSMHSDIRMCIASDGNIGIGTNNPSQKLDIVGNTNISRILKIGGINQNDDEIKLQVYASSNNIIAIFKHPNDSQGIGITYDSIFALGSDTNVAQPIAIKSKGNASVVLNTNSIDRLTVLGNGNVGIGTNNANSRLHLHNTTANSDVGIRFSDFTSGAGATQGFAIGENSTQQAYLLNYGNTDMLFSTNNAERLRILANGNVGIGTTIPETALDVNGNLLIRAYGTTGSGTKGIFFRPDFVTTNQYNCSILTFDHSSSGANDGISINGYQGVSFCTGANTRQERMRISENGNVGIGTTNPAYRTHIKCVYDDISKGLHLDASDAVPSAPNQYALTIYPYIVGAGQVGWKFRSQSQIGGTQTPLTFDHAGNVILGGTISGNGSLLTSINAANISSGTISSLRLPVATETGLGNVIIGNGINVDFDGKISLKTASTTQLGGIKVGNNLNIDAEGVLSASASSTWSKWTANDGTIYATDLGSNIVIGQVQTGTSGSKFKVYPNSGQNACFFNGSVVMGTASSTSIFWNGLTDTYLARANAIGSFSSSSIVGDVVISSDKNIIIKSGIQSVTPSIYVKQTDGNVGIGKNNPSYKLDVGGSVNCSAILVNGSSIPIYDDTALTALVNTKDANVSNYVWTTSNILLADFVARDAVLNTAITANAYSDTKVSTYLGDTTTKTIGGILQVGTSSGGGIIKLGGAADDTGFDLAFIENRAYVTNKSEIVIFKGNDVEGSVGADRIRLRAGAIAFDTYSTTSTSATTESIRMYIDGAGNVGIGTTIPDNLLTIRTTTSTARLRLVSSSSTGNAYIRFMKSDGNTLGYDIGYEGATTNNLQFIAYNNSATGRIDMQIARGNGNVGIGTAPSATYKLDVNGSINATSLLISGTAINQSKWTTSGTSIYYNTGNVGIGNLAPIGTIAIGDSSLANSDGFMVIGKNNGAGGSRHFRLGQNANFDFVIGDYGGANVAGTWLETFKMSYLAPANSLVITSAGNVGLGVSPAVKFQVGASGALRVSTGTNDYTLIGTADADSASNTRIVLSSNARIGYTGRIQYLATSSGYHSFCTTNSNTEVFRISNTGLYFQNNNWHLCLQEYRRFYFGSNLGGGITFISGGMSTSANAKTIEFRRTYDDATLGYFENSGLLRSWGYTSLSDERIKKNIRDIDDDEALQKILLIQPKKYNYIDKEKNKGKDITGFIAQQINEVIPEAITKTNGIIPNIYKYCSVINKREIQYSIPLNVPFDTDVIITADEDGMGERYKIKEIYDDYFVIDKDLENDEVFVKGYEITDLHNLNKDMIFTLNVNATQELHKIIMKQKEEITDLKERLAKIEAVLSGMLSGST